MLPESPKSVQHPTVTDESIDDARRIRDLLGGVMAMRSPDLMRGAVGEAYAVAAQLVDRLERAFVVEHERARHVAQAANSGASVVTR